MPLHTVMSAASTLLPVRVCTDACVQTVYPLYRISAGQPGDASQIDASNIATVLFQNPDGAWSILSPDERWGEFGIHGGEYVLFDTDATPHPGELVAAAHPGCDEPHLEIYRAGFPPDSDVIGVARLKVNIALFGKYAA